MGLHITWLHVVVPLVGIWVSVSSQAEVTTLYAGYQISLTTVEVTHKCCVICFQLCKSYFVVNFFLWLLRHVNMGSFVHILAVHIAPSSY
jgi:hypothetical protein